MNAKGKSRSRQWLGVGALAVMILSSAGCIHNREAFYFGNYSEAERLFSKGEYEKAIQKYQSFIDENPEGNLAIISHYYVARSHEALGHKDEAMQLYRQIIEKHPDVIWANFSETQIKELEAAPAQAEGPSLSPTPAPSA